MTAESKGFTFEMAEMVTLEVQFSDGDMRRLEAVAAQCELSPAALVRAVTMAGVQEGEDMIETLFQLIYGPGLRPSLGVFVDEPSE